MNDQNLTPPSAPEPKGPSTGEKLYGWGKKNEIILYLFFGVLTTAINFFTYLFFSHVMDLQMTLAVLLAWFISVLFAYVTNKIWVFKKRGKNPKKVLEEASLFFAVRAITGLLDVLLMWIFVTQLSFDDVWMKLWINVLIVILNYIASKLWVFSHKAEAGAKGSKKSKKK